MFKPCKKCGELEQKNSGLTEKNHVQFNQLKNLWEKERELNLDKKRLEERIESYLEEKKGLRTEVEELKSRLNYIDGALKILNNAISGSLFAGEFYSTLSINKYGSVVFTLKPRGYRRTITIGEIKVRMYDSRDSLYSVEITKFGNGILDDLLIKVMEEHNLKFKNDTERNMFEICTTTSLNSFFKALDEIFTEVQTRYEKLLDGLKPKEEPQKKNK